MRLVSSKCICAVAAIILIIAATVAFMFCPKTYLTLRDEHGSIYARYPMEEGDRFSISFIHSVNQYPLTDTFEICDGHIFVEECEYCSFGAGVQTELNPGETMEYVYIDKYGYQGKAMVIRNIHQNRDNVRYNVGTVSDHYLTVNGKEISLRDLCGKNAAVYFNYEHFRF